MDSYQCGPYTIEITKGDAGLFYGTCAELSGLLVAGPDANSVMKDAPGVIDALLVAAAD